MEHYISYQNNLKKDTLNIIIKNVRHFSGIRQGPRVCFLPNTHLFLKYRPKFLRNVKFRTGIKMTPVFLTTVPRAKSHG